MNIKDFLQLVNTWWKKYIDDCPKVWAHLRIEKDIIHYIPDIEVLDKHIEYYKDYLERAIKRNWDEPFFYSF